MGIWLQSEQWQASKPASKAGEARTPNSTYTADAACECHTQLFKAHRKVVLTGVEAERVDTSDFIANLDQTRLLRWPWRAIRELQQLGTGRRRTDWVVGSNQISGADKHVTGRLTLPSKKAFRLN